MVSTGRVPGSIDPATIYSFAPITPAELGNYRLQGEVLVAAAGMAPPLWRSLLQVPWLKTPGRLWEDGGNYTRGDIIVSDPNPLPAGHVVIGHRAVVPVAGGSIFAKKIKKVKRAKAPSMPVRFDNQGVHRLEFQAAVSLMDDTEPQGSGLQLSGPVPAFNLRDQAFLLLHFMSTGRGRMKYPRVTHPCMSTRSCRESWSRWQW